MFLLSLSLKTTNSASVKECTGKGEQIVKDRKTRGKVKPWLLTRTKPWTTKLGETDDEAVCQPEWRSGREWIESSCRCGHG